MSRALSAIPLPGQAGFYSGGKPGIHLFFVVLRLFAGLISGDGGLVLSRIYRLNPVFDKSKRAMAG